MRATVILAFAVFIASTCWGETYRWVDEKGTIHFTEDYGSIPERHRGRVQERKDKPNDLVPKTDGTLRKEQEEDSIRIFQEVPREASIEEQPVNKNRIESDAADALRTIVSLWKDGQFEALYEYGTEASKGRVSREMFAKRMKNSRWGLASSWETIRDIDARFKSPTLVYVTAKIGYRPKGLGDVRVHTASYRMIFENGMWRTDLSHF
jgi:hypothetical protein